MREYTISGVKVIARDFWAAVEAVAQGLSDYCQEGSEVSAMDGWEEEDAYWAAQEEEFDF